MTAQLRPEATSIEIAYRRLAIAILRLDVASIAAELESKRSKPIDFHEQAESSTDYPRAA